MSDQVSDTGEISIAQLESNELPIAMIQAYNREVAEAEGKMLYHVRRTVLEMLRDRGYMVDESEVEASLNVFREAHGGELTRENFVIRKGMGEIDNSKQILVYFSEMKEDLVQVKTIKDCCNRLKAEGASNAILILEKDFEISLYAGEAMKEASRLYNIEFFQMAELLVNVTKHQLVPEHQPLSWEESRAFLESPDGRKELPGIMEWDPIARYHGLKKGQVVKIIYKRDEETETPSPRYLLVK